MAQRMYEEEYIRATAVKVRSLVPSWRQSITTAEMPAAVERVYEEGRKNGRNEGYNNGYGTGYTKGYDQGNKAGYDKGYEAGTAAGGGVELPELTNPGTAEDLLAGKELIDGEGNIVKGTIPVVQMGIAWQATRHHFYSSDNVPYISTITEIDKPVYMSPSTGPIISVNAPASNYGNAPTNKVVKGYTFTSEAGLKVEGEIEDGNEVRY